VNLQILIELYEGSKNSHSLELFLQFGSGEEYGNIPAPFKESDREYPNSPYALSKQLTTNTGIMLYNNFHFPISIVRPGNIFGEYQESNKFIPYIVNKLRLNEVIETTLGEQRRDFIYVKDLVDGIYQVLEKFPIFVGKIFNLSSGKSHTLKDIIEFCKKNLKSTSFVNYGGVEYRENEIMNFTLSTSRFQELANFNFDFDIYSKLKEYLDRNGDIDL
jgi:nucleoside-diphosphate-sugar epimerase